MGKRSREKRERRDGEAVETAAAAPRRPAPSPSPGDDLFAPRPAAAPMPWGALLRAHQTPLLVIFALAVFVRIRLLYEIGQTPYFEASNIDSEAYRQWATTIANGQWLPTRSFYQSPFYAYYLAVLYTLFGVGDQWSPRIAQIVLGSVSPLLVYGIGARLFTTRVGWIAGVLLALYGPIVLEEVTISKTTLLVTSSLTAFVLYLRYGPSANRRGMLLSGLVFGITVIGVGQWLPAFLALAAWAYALPERASTAERRGVAAAFLAGGLAVMLPMIAWNSANGGGLILTSGDAGLNLYTGNNPRATGLPREPDGVRNTPQFEDTDAKRVAEQQTGRTLTPAEVSSYWSGEAVRWATANPGAWLRVVGLKLQTLWNAYEIPDNYHYPFMRAHFLPFLWVLVTFAVVAPLALVGMAMPFWRRRDVTALYVAGGVYLATALLFYVRGRYRIPAVPFLIVFAAVGIERTLHAFRAQDWPRVVALAGGLVAAVLFTNREHCEPPHHGLPDICLGGDTWFDQEWLKISEWYRNAGDIDQAVRYAERAQECTRPRSAGLIAFWLGELETMRTQRLARAGQRDEARAAARRAEGFLRTSIRLGFRKPQSVNAIAVAYTEVGEPQRAIDELEAQQFAGTLDRNGAKLLGRALVAVGRCGDAEKTLVRLDGGTASAETQALLATCGGTGAAP